MTEHHSSAGTEHATFRGAQCASYPNCSGGCGLGCTREHDAVDRDHIAELLYDHFEELTYGLASQIGDRLLKTFDMRKK